ncbi:hypothetical protein EVAR_44136_1 [Eumeta japonica]|uniref:Uncharacterized protein n=1 Tax=Eumeta variegata TaxID=151549 RepID=A0A4C1XLP0_EUMVA|nr:hypothetical protein EVAR_44136_1 [Eumeta japonica]
MRGRMNSVRLLITKIPPRILLSVRRLRAISGSVACSKRYVCKCASNRQVVIGLNIYVLPNIAIIRRPRCVEMDLNLKQCKAMFQGTNYNLCSTSKGRPRGGGRRGGERPAHVRGVIKLFITRSARLEEAGEGRARAYSPRSTQITRVELTPALVRHTAHSRAVDVHHV